MPKSTSTSKRSRTKVSRKSMKAREAALNAKMLKPRRNRPGTSSLRETRKQMKSHGPAIKYPGMLRYIRAELREYGRTNQDYRVGDRPPLSELGSKVPKISNDAVEFMRDYLEQELVTGISQAFQLSLDAGAQSLLPRDLRRARRFDAFHEKPDNPVAYLTKFDQPARTD